MSDTLAFVGAGALGQTFAGLLAQSQQPSTLLATPRTAAQLLAAGAITLRGAVSATVPVVSTAPRPGQVQVITAAKQLPAGAGVIFLTKGHQLPAAAATVAATWPQPDDKAAWVTGFQNGMATADLLTSIFGAARVLHGATILSGERQPDGVVHVTSLGATYLGAPGVANDLRADAAVATLQRANIPASVPDDIQGVLWSKACNAAGVFGVSVLARIPAAQIFAEPHWLRAYLTLIRETAAIAAACGITVGNYPQFPPIQTLVTQAVATTLAGVPDGPLPQGGSLPSMTQDLLAGRPLEVEAVFGDLVQRAAQMGVSVPALTLVCDLLRGIDRSLHERREEALPG